MPGFAKRVLLWVAKSKKGVWIILEARGRLLESTGDLTSTIIHKKEMYLKNQTAGPS